MKDAPDMWGRLSKLPGKAAISRSMNPSLRLTPSPALPSLAPPKSVGHEDLPRPFHHSSAPTEQAEHATTVPSFRCVATSGRDLPVRGNVPADLAVFLSRGFMEERRSRAYACGLTGNDFISFGRHCANTSTQPGDRGHRGVQTTQQRGNSGSHHVTILYLFSKTKDYVTQDLGLQPI